MQESNKYSETERAICYKKENTGCRLTMIFNKEIKTVDISQEIFIRNDEPMLEPMESDWIRYSAKYGHWQSVAPVLGAEDIKFLNNKYNELFG